MSRFVLFFSLGLVCCIMFLNIHTTAYAQPVDGATVNESSASENWYVGTDACAECHADTVKAFKTNSKKATSKNSVMIMKEKLTEAEFEGCLSCHTTGYGSKKGFISYSKTPHLADVGCESCHGMGGLHSEDGSPESISRTPTIQLCETCHDDSRIARISYDGRIYSGGH